jgi:hypothetical protein
MTAGAPCAPDLCHHHGIVEGKPAPPSYVVLREIAPGRFELVGEVERRPGLTARAARAQAVEDATGGKARPGDVHAAILRSEWRIAFEL